VNPDYRFPNQLTVRMRYLEGIPLDPTTLVLSAMNTGKTTWLINQLRALSPELSVLVITCRQSLAFNLYQKLIELGFVHYKEDIDAGTMIHAPRCIVQLDSIIRVGRTYDVIIVDEIQSHISHYTSSTLENKLPVVHTKVVQLFAVCNSAVFMDADADESTVHYIQSVLHRPITKTIVNLYKTDTDKVIVVNRPRWHETCCCCQYK
jgi:hypothetical protein